MIFETHFRTRLTSKGVKDEMGTTTRVHSSHSESAFVTCARITGSRRRREIFCLIESKKQILRLSFFSRFSGQGDHRVTSIVSAILHGGRRTDRSYHNLTWTDHLYRCFHYCFIDISSLSSMSLVIFEKYRRMETRFFSSHFV